jgi:hypothetical protein
MNERTGHAKVNRWVLFNEPQDGLDRLNAISGPRPGICKFRRMCGEIIHRGNTLKLLSNLLWYHASIHGIERAGEPFRAIVKCSSQGGV